LKASLAHFLVNLFTSAAENRRMPGSAWLPAQMPECATARKCAFLARRAS